MHQHHSSTNPKRFVSISRKCEKESIDQGNTSVQLLLVLALLVNMNKPEKSKNHEKKSENMRKSERGARGYEERRQECYLFDGED